MGLVIVCQVLSTDVADHLGEYATFEEMGHGQGFFRGVVLEEPVSSAVSASSSESRISLPLYAAMNAATGLPMQLSASTAVALFAGTIAACAGSGLLASRCLAQAEPADLL